MKESEIGYLTEDPARDYSFAIKRCKTAAQLRSVLSEWSELAPDAVAQASALADDEDLPRLWKIAKNERAEVSQLEEVMAKVGFVLIPERMMRATLASSRSKAPWGTAWIRLREVRAATQPTR